MQYYKIKYYENAKYREKVQIILSAVELVLAALAVTFMYLFVSTGAGSNTPDYSVAAIVFTFVFCAYYLVQGAFAIVTFSKTSNKNPIDKIFLSISVAILPLACGIYGIMVCI